MFARSRQVHGGKAAQLLGDAHELFQGTLRHKGS